MMRRDGERLTIEGPVTFDTVPELLVAAETYAGKEIAAIDFAAVTEVDSAAVALALDWLRRAERADVALRLLNLPQSMRNLAELYGVSELLQPATS